MSLPWVSEPVTLHGSRDDGMCDLTPEQCAYKQRYWVFWYEADRRYALPTVAFLMSCIIFFSLFNVVNTFAPYSLTKSSFWRRTASITRGASYKYWRFGSWSTQSLGAYMLGAVGFIFFAAMTLGPQPYYWPNTKELSYGNSPPIATRTGWMALGCLPFVPILGTKANPIATLLGTSHENLIVWHNWIAWAMFVLALIHTFPFVVHHMWVGDIAMQFSMGGLWVTGVIALLAQAWLTFFSIRWLRERYYEIFKFTHFFAALIFMIFFFLHCDHILTAWDYFIAAAVLYALSWLYSQCRTYIEHGFKHKAVLSLETEDMLKITIDTNAEWTQGQHIYLRFLKLGVHALAAHPFTICSLTGTRENGRNQMTFYVRPRGGLTQRLGLLAAKQPGMSVPVLLDGPYGGVKDRWFNGFDHYVVIGGGAGAGFTLGLAHWFIRRWASNPSQSGKMTLVVSSRDPGMRRWYLEALTQSLPTTKKDNWESELPPYLSVRIHETGISEMPESSGSDKEGNKNDSATKQARGEENADLTHASTTISQGRPDISALGSEAVSSSGATVGIVVCGPASMVHDAAKVAASAQGSIAKCRSGASEVWFHKESFS